MKDKDNIWISMARYLAGEMEVREEIAFGERSKNDSELQKELNIMEKSWTFFNDQSSPEDADPGRAWKILHERLETDGLLKKSHLGTRNRRMAPAMQIAASLLLILAVGIPIIRFGFNLGSEEPDSYKQLSEKGVSTIDLPDGSRVYLNQGSEISYPRSFDQERTVILNGEAFFEVMSDPVNPFTVRSGQVLVSVLGTSFNVKKGGQENNVEVFVETGKVRMALQNQDNFITLEPGDLGKADASSLSRTEQSEPNYISWKTKHFIFVDEKLAMVLCELEEAYHVEIRTEGVSLDELRITSTYSEQSIDSILETLGAAFGMKVQKEEAIYYLKP